MKEPWNNPRDYKTDDKTRYDQRYQRGIFYLINILMAIEIVVDYAHQKGSSNANRNLLAELEVIAEDILEQPIFSTLKPFFSGFPPLEYDNDFYANDGYLFFINFLGLLKKEYELSGEHDYEIPKEIIVLLKKAKMLTDEASEISEACLLINKKHIRLREASGRLGPEISITKREYEFLRALHNKKGREATYEELNAKVKRTRRSNSKDDGRNRIIQIYKGIKKKLSTSNKELIVKTYEGLSLSCKSKKI